MEVPEERVAICSNCDEEQAVKRYTQGGLDERVCERCFDRLTVQDLLEETLTKVLALERDNRYDEALACLDTILESNRYRDHDGWLANSVALHRTSVLFDAGRYMDAEQAYGEWAQIGFIDIWRRQLHALGLAKTLEALGREREAVPVLESALGHEEPKDLPLALTVLTELVRISDRLALPIDSKWLRIAEAVAECYSVDMPARDSLGESILALEEVTRGMQPMRTNE